MFGSARRHFSAAAWQAMMQRQHGVGGDAVHILGIGNMGKYIAYSLSYQDSKPVTFLFHRPSLADEWQHADRTLRCITEGAIGEVHHGLSVELLPSPVTDPIKHLVVATKAQGTVSALERVKYRLNAQSSIIFLQNGMGAMDEVSTTVFPDLASRPTYWAGICSAGVYSTDPFTIVHAGRGPLLLGLVGAGGGARLTDIDAANAASQDTMIRRLAAASKLETSILPPERIKEAQLQKLAVNAIINPLTAIFRCKNGALLESPKKRALMDLLVLETAPILRELLDQPSTRFADENIRDLVVSVAQKTAANTSSMAQDVHKGVNTEIDYINGYVVKQGARLGLPHVHNATLVRLVGERAVIKDEDIPATFHQ